MMNDLQLETPRPRLRLISLIRAGNEASRRVSEKIGMHLVAEIAPNDIPYRKYGIDSTGDERVEQ